MRLQLFHLYRLSMLFNIFFCIFLQYICIYICVFCVFRSVCTLCFVINSNGLITRTTDQGHTTRSPLSVRTCATPNHNHLWPSFGPLGCCDSAVVVGAVVGCSDDGVGGCAPLCCGGSGVMTVAAAVESVDIHQDL